MSVDLTRLPGGPRISDIPVYRPPSWVYLSPTAYAALIAALADPFSQYALLAGRSGGQLLKGGTGVNDFLTLQSTAGAGVADYISFLVGNAGATEAMRILHSGMVGIGTTTPQSSNFVVIGTSGSSYVLADFVYDQTGSSADSGTIRAVARQLGAGNSAVRAMESHVIRATAASAGNTWAHEFGTHSQVAGNGTTENLGLYISSSHTGWLSTGVRNDTAVLILGEDGWTHAIRYYDTDSATVLFDVDQSGNITAKGTSQTFSGYGAGILKTNSSGVISANATIDASDIANRTRRVTIDLAAGFQTAGTGTKNASAGLRITYVDAEVGDWRWQIPVPGDLVTGNVTLWWLWEAVTTSANCSWFVSMGANYAAAAHSPLNIANAVTGTFTSAGTASQLVLSSAVSTSNVTAGYGDIAIFLRRDGTAGGDTINADVQLRAIWLEYTADM